ncbi:MAG: hypothetical protein HUJ26_15890 [Planctomycetaceae bacterium]|nr:hypothetical protein [Planctomycetaceae bacterium]
MGARHKLNQLYVVGSALFAGLFGLLAESWLVFLGVLMVLLALMVHGGDIRLQQITRPQPVRVHRRPVHPRRHR